MEGTTQQQLEACVRTHLPEISGKLYFERLRTGKYNESWLFITDEGEFVLRIAPPDETPGLFYERRMMRQEPALHELLLAQTSLPVPRILAQDFSRRTLERDFLILERLPGRALSESPEVDLDFVFWQAGHFLAEVHRIMGAQYGYTGAHRCMEPKGDWFSAFEEMWARLLDDVVATGEYAPEEARDLRDALRRRREIFPADKPASLLHMDLWQQNILVDREGKITALLDWDRALWGDPEIEFAVLDYTGMATGAFWEGYGEPRDASPEAQVRQTFYLLYELQKYIVIRHARDRSPKRARHYRRQAMEIVRRVLW